MSEVRAGIVVTGTEVLTGRIADRNGPWISERLAELGVDVAHILVVGDRPDDLEAALRFMAGEGMDLIVTSGGLGPTADDLTAEIVARFAGRELVLDEEVEEKIAEILRGFARRFQLRPRGGARGQPQAGDGARGRRSRSTRSAPRRASSSRADGQRRRRPARPAARAAADVAGGARGRAGRGAARPGRRRCAATRCACSASPSRRSPRACARSRTRASPLPEVEITTCLRRGEIEIDVRYRDEAAGRPRRCEAGLAARHARHLFSLDGETIDSQVADAAAAGHRARPGRVVQRRPAGGPDHRPARAPRPTWPAASSPTRTRPRRSCSASTRR